MLRPYLGWPILVYAFLCVLRAPVVNRHQPRINSNPNSRSFSSVGHPDERSQPLAA